MLLINLEKCVRSFVLTWKDELFNFIITVYLIFNDTFSIPVGDFYIWQRKINISDKYANIVVPIGIFCVTFFNIIIADIQCLIPCNSCWFIYTIKRQIKISENHVSILFLFDSCLMTDYNEIISDTKFYSPDISVWFLSIRYMTQDSRQLCYIFITFGKLRYDSSQWSYSLCSTLSYLYQLMIFHP